MPHSGYDTEVSEIDPKKAKIVYPCLWIYVVIGTQEQVLRDHIDSVLRGRTRRVNFSKRSPGGKYVSLEVEVEVKDEAERNQFYQELKKSPDVKMIL